MNSADSSNNILITLKWSPCIFLAFCTLYFLSLLAGSHISKHKSSGVVGTRLDWKSSVLLLLRIIFNLIAEIDLRSYLYKSGILVVRFSNSLRSVNLPQANVDRWLLFRDHLFMFCIFVFAAEPAERVLKTASICFTGLTLIWPDKFAADPSGAQCRRWPTGQPAPRRPRRPVRPGRRQRSRNPLRSNRSPASWSLLADMGTSNVSWE